VIAVLTNALLSVLLARAFGFVGLSLGTAIASLINAGLLLILLRRRLGQIGMAGLLSTLLRITLASAVMGAAAWGLHDWLARQLLVGSGFLTQVIRVGASIGAALVVLVAMARVLKIEEFDEAFAKVLRRFRGVSPGGTARG
jgi:putative peptidoglycan lipid II flippase